MKRKLLPLITLGAFAFNISNAGNITFNNLAAIPVSITPVHVADFSLTSSYTWGSTALTIPAYTTGVNFSSPQALISTGMGGPMIAAPASTHYLVSCVVQFGGGCAVGVGDNFTSPLTTQTVTCGATTYSVTYQVTGPTKDVVVTIM